MHASAALHYMGLAIKEGRKAISKSGDNPPVGCILVIDGMVFAKGHTGRPGEPHAEAMALSQLESCARDIVAFVTLEPCSFIGRTPSCAQAFINAGITKLYIGMIDPDPRNNGKGMEMLRKAGIEVHVGVLEFEIAEELAAFLGRAS